MRYLFALGREAALGAAEASAVVGRMGGSVLAGEGHVLIVDLSLPPAEVAALLARLGGTVKVAEVVGEVGAADAASLLQYLPPGGGKVRFGISLYQEGAANLVRRAATIGRDLKQLLRSSGRAARFVASRDNPLSSAIVQLEGLVGRPDTVELCLVTLPTGSASRRTIVAATRAVQDFRAYRRRDVGRPVRDLERGMVPPKLAQVLLNLAGVGEGSCVLDPFCGTGTVLQEALLAGAAEVVGRDIDPRAISQATENLRWLESHRPELRSRWTVRVHDARLPDPAIGLGRLDAVVFEPALGPLRPPRERAAQLRLASELVQLYERSLAAVAPLLRPGGRVAAVFPSFSGAAATAVKPTPTLRRVALLPEAAARAFGLPSRYEVLYRRPDQSVGRVVVAFEKAG